MMRGEWHGLAWKRRSGHPQLHFRSRSRTGAASTLLPTTRLPPPPPPQPQHFDHVRQHRSSRINTKCCMSIQIKTDVQISCACCCARSKSTRWGRCGKRGAALPNDMVLLRDSSVKALSEFWRICSVSPTALDIFIKSKLLFIAILTPLRFNLHRQMRPILKCQTSSPPSGKPGLPVKFDCRPHLQHKFQGFPGTRHA